MTPPAPDQRAARAERRNGNGNGHHAAPPSPDSERVLILAPTGRDADMLAAQLRRRGVQTAPCDDVHALCHAIDEGAGLAFVAEEALDGDALDCFVDHLRRQPAWSDLPVIAMIGHSTARQRRVESVLGAAGNVTLLPRPIRLATLFSVVGSALKSRRRQYEVRNLLQAFQRQVQQRDQFLAMLGHELRNPLAAIVNAVTILKDFPAGDPAITAEQHEVLARQSAHMARLVDELLDVARITTGKVTLRTQPVDIRDCASRALQALRLAMGHLHHHVELQSPRRPVTVNGDPVRLEQVLGNLLTNAVKYTPDGGTIWLTVGTEDGHAVVRVRDNGDGIPRDMLARIFEPFAQVTQSLDRSRGGLGIGLAVVRGLVELHGGRVEVTSDGPGFGTEFTVRIPLIADPRPASPAPQSPRPQCGRHVLIVEDNADARRSMARLLQLLGHRVDSAEDGPAGLEKARSIRPEVILLDIGLPGLNGYEVAGHLRQDPAFADTALIALTGYGQPEDQERVLQAGFDLHLVKPVDATKLNEILATLPRRP